MEKIYKNQVKLLLDVLPEVAKESSFALHGGTAINLFVRNMSRLSVDIDLTYLPIEDWDTSARNINDALSRIKERLEKSISGVLVVLKPDVSKLMISTKQAAIKLEVSRIGRGAYAETDLRVLCDKVQDEYDAFCEITVVPLGQLYGGKICAALDRQHPRDLFDVKYMLANEGFTEEIKTGFLYCLLGAKRPINEMLNPHFLDQESAFTNQFQGMTLEEFSYGDYEQVKKDLIEVVLKGLTDEDKEFLLNFKNLTPIWGKYAYSDFPSVRRKIQNLELLKDKNPEKHAQLYDLLRRALSK